jgi:vanillate O-demethylase monooxygenase subunit
MDLSHVEFLHPTTLGSGRVAEGRLTVMEHARSVEANRWMPGIDAPPFIGRSMDMTGRVDHWADMTWHAGSNLVLRVGLTDPGAGREAGREAIAYHLITPETRTTSHYFFGQSMNFGQDRPELKETIRAGVMGVFTGEDKPMIEACARMMDGRDFWDLEPVLIRSDGGAVKMRRVLRKLIDAERAI